MFTGITEEVGKIRDIAKKPYGECLGIECFLVCQDTKLGDSIMVNGVCLTIVDKDKDTLFFDVIKETLNRTSFSNIKNGMPVNLERAMRADGRFGGHIVSGHIDGTGTIIDIRHSSNNVEMVIKAEKSINQDIIEKGSVTLEGISLTVGRTYADKFTVFLIPHTLDNTTLKAKKIGDVINIETDIIGKYVRKCITGEREVKSTITENLLRDNGFF